MSTARARRQIEDEAAREEPWALESYEWDPLACIARKKRIIASGLNDAPVATATAFASGFGLELPVARGPDIGTLQQQVAANPTVEALPVLETVDRADAEPATHCEVVGCGVSLAGLKRYYVRMRVCEVHLHAPAIVVNGVISRFCQQCAKFQFVGEFSGSKKSCTATLERHNARHRAKVLARLQEQQDADSDCKASPADRKAKGKGTKRQNCAKPGRVDSGIMAAAIASAAAAVTAAVGASAPASSSDISGAARACLAPGYGPDPALYAAPAGVPMHAHPQSSGGPVSADLSAPTNPGSPQQQAYGGWDGASSLPPRPLVTTGGNGVVSQATSGNVGSLALQAPEHPPLPALLPHAQLPAQDAVKTGPWGPAPGSTAAPWEPYRALGNAGFGARAVRPPAYDVQSALGAMQNHLLAKVPGAAPPLPQLPLPGMFGGNPSIHGIGNRGSNSYPSTHRPHSLEHAGAALPIPSNRTVGDAGGIGLPSRGSTPGASNGAPGGQTDSQATARKAFMASVGMAVVAEARLSTFNGTRGADCTPSPQTLSGGEPCGSSGGMADAAAGACAGVMSQASPACSLNEGVSATRASGSGFAGADGSGGGGDSGAATGVVARINSIMQELCPLIEQFKQEVAHGSVAPSTTQGTIPRTGSHDASGTSWSQGEGARGAVAALGASSSGGLGVSAASAGHPRAGIQDRVGSNSLPPTVDAAVAMIKHASSQLTAALQVPTPGAQQWTVTSGAPEPAALQQLPSQPLDALQTLKQEAYSQPPHAQQPPHQPPLVRIPSQTPSYGQPPRAPPQAAQPPAPGWRYASSHPGVMVNVGSGSLPPLVPPPQDPNAYPGYLAALPPQPALPPAAYPGMQPHAPDVQAPPSYATDAAPQPHHALTHPAGQMGPLAAGLGSQTSFGGEGDDDLMLQLMSFLDDAEDGTKAPSHSHPPPLEQQQAQVFEGFAATMQQSVVMSQQVAQSMPYGARASPFHTWNAPVGAAPQVPMAPAAPLSPPQHALHAQHHPQPHPHPHQPYQLHPFHAAAGSAPRGHFGPGPVYPQQHHAAGAAPWGMPGMPSQPPAVAEMDAADEIDPRELTRVSLKAMNVLPHELPPNLRANLRRWLKEARAEALQATLRPGCVQLVVDVRRLPPPPGAAAPAAASVDDDLAAHLIPAQDAEQAAVDVFRIMGQRLCDTYVQVGHKVLQIRVGERPVVLSWEEAAEDGSLVGAKYPVVKGCSAAAVCAGSQATLELQGAHLAHSRTKAFARLRGHELTAARLPLEPATTTTAAAGSTSGSDGGFSMRMSVTVPSGVVGLMVVEVGVGHLLGDWWPVLVLPRGQEGSAEELQRLQAAADVAPQPPAGLEQGAGRAGREFHRLLLDLSAVLEVLADAAAASASSVDTSGTSPVVAAQASPAAACPLSSPTAAAVVRSFPPDDGATRASNCDASTASGSAVGWADTLTSTGVGSTLASFVTTSSASMLAAAGSSAAFLPGHAVPHASAAAGAVGIAGIRTAAGPAVAPPPQLAVRQALSRTAKLLRYVVGKGLPHLTGLLLAAADSLVRFLESSRPALPAQATQADVAPGAPPSTASLLAAVGVDPQALLPLAMLSGSAETVDRLAVFASTVLGTPIRLDLPQGPLGMSLLHLAALLPDGGALASHLVATQPWAAWEWLSLGWKPPRRTGQVPAAASCTSPAAEPTGTNGKAETAAAQSLGNGPAADSSAQAGPQGNGVEGEPEADGSDDGAEEEDDDEGGELSVPEEGQPRMAPRLTPGFLSLLLGQSQPLQKVVSVLQAPPAPQPFARAEPALGALLEAFEAWGRGGCALLSALCEQLARQRL